MKKIFIARIAVSFLLIGILSTPATPQGGCTKYLLWSLSSHSSMDPAVQEDASWLAGIAQVEAEHGSGTSPECNYHRTEPNAPGWYGECFQYAYTCPTPPTPPPTAPSGTGPGPSCPSCSAGHPINLTNGNTYIQQTDIQIPGIGGGLVLSRTWNSIWPPSQSAMNSGLFGVNWRSAYEERVFSVAGGTAEYARADGSFWSFLLYGSPATFHVVAPANGRATLAYGASQWTLTFDNGEQRVFDNTSGSLVAIVDRNGNTTQLSYDGTGRLVTVTDPASRHLYFAYGSSASGLVTSITSDLGISLSYLYDSQGRLIQVTKPDQTIVSFEYDSNSLITAVKDSDGKILESHTYDSKSRGLTSSRANGVEAVTVSYPTQ
jgi:YD repeat-containing protein